MAFAMLVKLTSKHQLRLPKSITQAVAAAEYFDVAVRHGQIVLTPIRIQRGDAVRANLDVQASDVAAAVNWARGQARAPASAAKPPGTYRAGSKTKKRPGKS